MITKTSSSSSSFTFHNIDKELNYTVYSAIIETLLGWDFFPYPPCTREQLEQVNLFTIACKSESVNNNNNNNNNNNKQDKLNIDCISNMIGVVGIVWVPLSLMNQIEGYIQIVLVQSHYRGNNIATSLLQRVLHLIFVGNINKQQIVRWRLHTMENSHRTNEYLRLTLIKKEEENQKEKEELHQIAKESEILKQKLQEAQQLVSAVPRVYEKFGFFIRRNMFSYYNKSADGVEMVRTVQSARKRR